MFTVGKRVSFSVVIAVLVGWGIFSILFLQASSTLLEAQTYELDKPVPLPSGVKLNFQVDKKVYKAGDTVLAALRNDSRKKIWVAERANGCDNSWWRLERLDESGEEWRTVTISKKTCEQKTLGLVLFEKHTILSAEWLAVVPSDELGNIVHPAPSGTYRLAVPYIQAVAPKEGDWLLDDVHTINSPSFTIQ